MTVATVERTAASTILRAETCAAWDEYLEAVRSQSPLRYEEVEPWAWAKLQTQLRAVEARREALQ